VTDPHFVTFSSSSHTTIRNSNPNPNPNPDPQIGAEIRKLSPF